MVRLAISWQRSELLGIPTTCRLAGQFAIWKPKHIIAMLRAPFRASNVLARYLAGQRALAFQESFYILAFFLA
jgi:hypothetical protein